MAQCCVVVEHPTVQKSATHDITEAQAEVIRGYRIVSAVRLFPVVDTDYVPTEDKWEKNIVISGDV